MRPIIVYPNPLNQDPNKKEYCLWIGENRFKAYEYLYLEKSLDNFLTIPAFIHSPPNNKNDKKVLQLSENIHRQNLSSKEIRNTLSYFKSEGLSTRDIANLINKTDGYVSNILSAKQGAEILNKMGITPEEFLDSNSTLSQIKDLPKEEIKRDDKKQRPSSNYTRNSF